MANKLEIEEGSVVILSIDSQLVEGTVSQISPCGQQVKVEFEPPSQWFNRSMVLDVIGAFNRYQTVDEFEKHIDKEVHDLATGEKLSLTS